MQRLFTFYKKDRTKFENLTCVDTNLIVGLVVGLGVPIIAAVIAVILLQRRRRTTTDISSKSASMNSLEPKEITEIKIRDRIGGGNFGRTTEP